jgi:5-deoxy-glucuronate isomerase
MPDPRLLRHPGPPDPSDGAVHRLSPADAGWAYVGFAVHRLQAGMGFERRPDGREVALVPLEGAVGLSAGGQRFGSVGGRSGLFDGPPAPVALVAPDVPIEVAAESDAVVVVAHAPAGDVRLTRLIEPSTVLVESRGSGSTARTVHHLLPPAAEAGRLILFEVFTPGGNWSSYPPHKHDTEDPPREALLEELYYHRIARPGGYALQRVYTPDRSLDESMAAGDGDVVLVPRGYHPVGMPAGYDGYYLNVMAGPGRRWHFTIDPDHAWLMDWQPPTSREDE